MMKIVLVAASFALASAAVAQTQPGQTTPSITPSQTPSVTPSQTPGVIPPSQPPVVGGPAPVIGGLGKCENMIGAEKEKCLQDERAGTGSSTGRAPAGTGAQNTAPAGSVR
jgi:hypothetical protein